MTSRPATPESPERVATLRELIAEIKQPLWRLAANARLDELERSEALAQTEIKGHMKIEDDLKAELQQVREQWSDEGMNKILAMSEKQIDALCRLEGQDPKDVSTIAKQAMELALLKHQLSEAQARIAELEKLLQEIMACPRSDPNRGKGRWFSVMAKTGLIERIGEALKSRA